MLRTLPLPSTSTFLVDSDLLIMNANNYFAKEWKINRPQLFRLPRMQAENRLKIAEFDGKTNALFETTKNATFIGIDNSLFMSSNLKNWKEVLRCENRKNMFWHLIEARDGTLFVQEYGTLTGIYRSVDGGETWKQVVDCKKIDRRARHFHSLAFDQFRDLLVVTLGDGNLVKIAISKDYGETWKALSNSAYQCLPIVVMKDFLVFGMDSAISCGVISWNPSKNEWRSIHLKYFGKPRITDRLQASDLKRLANGTWAMSTGGGSFLVSKDLNNWGCYVCGEGSGFEAHTISNELNGVMAVAMGDTTVIADSEAIAHSDLQWDVRRHHAVLNKMRGLIYVVKRLPLRVK